MEGPVMPLVHWFATEGRDLPWRRTRDPYKIWISEVILQQTRIDQGLGYYLRFVERFPTVADLAAADTDTLMKYWEGLGYYSRARNLHHTARIIATELGGTFPDDYRALLKLKGIGPYTARAVGSMAFDNPVGVVDGNVFRVLSRYLADFSPIDVPATRNAHQERLDTWIAQAIAVSGDTRIPSQFNQALMDLGATVCTPKRAACTRCPLVTHCRAQAQDLVEQLPVKAKKLQRKTVWFHFFLAGDRDNLWVQRRPATGLWPQLWELPNVEVTEAEWQKGDLPGYALRGAFKHVFTHLDMLIKVYEGPDLRALEGREVAPPGEGPLQIPRNALAGRAFSRAVLKIFERYLGEESYFPS